jgi:hypothetical protein
MGHRVRRIWCEREKICASVHPNPIAYPGASHDTIQNQPPTPTIQPMSVVTRLHPCPTTIHRPRASALCLSRGVGTLYMQRLRFQTFPSAQTGQQPMEANLRPTTTKQALRTKATQDPNATRNQAPNKKRRLHVQL